MDSGSEPYPDSRRCSQCLESRRRTLYSNQPVLGWTYGMVFFGPRNGPRFHQIVNRICALTSQYCHYSIVLQYCHSTVTTVLSQYCHYSTVTRQLLPNPVGGPFGNLRNVHYSSARSFLEGYKQLQLEPWFSCITKLHFTVVLGRPCNKQGPSRLQGVRHLGKVSLCLLQFRAEGRPHILIGKFVGT
jgi:hypothetical protein